MTDNVRGEVYFEADGKAWTLAYPTKSLIRLERELKLGVAEIGQRMGASMSLDFLCAVFWAGLLKRQPEITLDASADLMDEVGLAEIGNLIGQAFGAALFPSAGEADGTGSRPRRARPKAGIGAPS